MIKSLMTVVVVILLVPALGSAQCMVFGPPYATATYMGSQYVGVTFLTGSSLPTNCTPMGTVLPGGGLRCRTLITPATMYNCPLATMGGMCRGLLAAVPLTALPGTFMCTWTCDCGAGPEVFVIDNSDGLPVELMDFEVEDG